MPAPLLSTTHCLLSLIITSSTVFAQAFDVDDADSLDFESFHKEEKKVIKSQDKNNPEKMPNHPALNKRNNSSNSSNVIQTGKKSKTLEIRTRYSLASSQHSPNAVTYAIETLHKQMAQQCPNGWNKLREWSVAVEQDFYLYYELECR